MASLNPTSVLIAEDVQGGLVVELKGDDLPWGRKRELAAFESGGAVDIADGGIYLPGNTRPVVQVMAIKQRPLVLKGAFRDHMDQQAKGGKPDGKGGTVGHARSMRDGLEQIRHRANPVRITWEGDERYGLLQEAKFSEEDSSNIAYELTFFIAVPPSVAKSQEQTDISSKPAAPDDIAAQMAANARAQQAQMLALAITAAVSATIASAWGSLTSSLDNVTVYAAKFGAATLSTPQHALTAMRNVQSACQAAQQNVANLKAVLDQSRADATMVVNNATNQTAWWSSLYASEVLLDQILDNMRKIRALTLAQVRQATRLYRVQPGDTLESIALQQLGSRSRALDLGIRQDDLVVGKYVRVPEAA